MTAPALSVSASSASELVVDVLVLGVRSGADGPSLLTADERFSALAASLADIGFTGGKDDFRRVPSPVDSVRSVALVGLGAGEPDAAALRYAAGTAARGATGVDSLGIALPADDDDALLAVLEGAAVGAYSYSDYRSAGQDERSRPASTVIVVGRSARADELAERASVIAGAVHTVRDLVNAPPSDLYPESLADHAVALSAGLPLEVEVLADDALVAGGYGGIVGVGQGSPRGPRLVKVSYSPADAAAHLALVGKGITFDTGGISLKPAASMVGMKYDMTGSATVLAVVIAAARLQVPVRLTAWLCLAENMPSGTAIRPNDVLRIRGGKTVEVLNTDAEGRLVLADGLVAAGEEGPEAIVDVATLTGAAIVAMGPRYVATMGDESLVGDVVAAARRAGEPFWPMPLPADMRPLLDSDVADIANAKIGNTAGGMLLAGLFLKEFVPDAADGSGPIPWAHLDIAGAANNGAGGYGFTGKGPTGVAVRALIDWVETTAQGRRTAR